MGTLPRSLKLLSVVSGISNTSLADHYSDMAAGVNTKKMGTRQILSETTWCPFLLCGQEPTSGCPTVALASLGPGGTVSSSFSSMPLEDCCTDQPV